MSTAARLETQIRSYILESFLYTSDQAKLRNEDSFLEEGILDSTGILELLMFVEETFGVQVDDEEVIPENFDSVDRLKQYLLQKTGEATPHAGA